jgi:hypothetical protein
MNYRMHLKRANILNCSLRKCFGRFEDGESVLTLLIIYPTRFSICGPAGFSKSISKTYTIWVAAMDTIVIEMYNNHCISINFI